MKQILQFIANLQDQNDFEKVDQMVDALEDVWTHLIDPQFNFDDEGNNGTDPVFSHF